MVKENQNLSFSLLVKMSLFVVVVWFLSAILTYILFDNWSERGTVGDMFGSVNALFSGLAFAALLYTILLQRDEVKLNRSEIEMNRKELKKSVSAQQKSQEALREQVAQTHLTTKINAISTIINYYNAQITNHNNPEVVEKAKMKRKQLIQKIDELIDGMDDSNIDE